MKEVNNVTGNTIEAVVVSANTIINSLVKRIATLEEKIKQSKGDSSKVEKNTMKIVSNKEKAYLEASTDSGKFFVELGRKG